MLLVDPETIADTYIRDTNLNSPPCLGGVAAASADGVVVK